MSNESLVVTQEYKDLDETLYALAIAEVDRKIAKYRHRINHLRKKHDMSFDEFTAHLCGRANIEQEDEPTLEWEAALDMLSDWEATKKVSNIDRKFEEIEHTADLAIRAYGRDMRELFANAAYGMFALMAEPSLEGPACEREVSLEATDYESLLVDWLNELIYLHEVERETYYQFAIETLSPAKLQARVTGGATKNKTKAIKAATFHELAIEETANGLVATIVFDV